MPQLAPVVPNERLESLDVLRGFALLGILAMNIRAMSAPFGSYMYPYALFDYDGLSRVGYVFTSVVYELKMMGLFSMLFGAGVLLYDAKSIVAGTPARGLWFRRMFWLLVIGLIHAYLIWDGDILVPYALCGMLVLWWVRRLPAWALGAGSLLVLGIGALLTVGHGLSWESMSEADRLEELAVWMPTREQAQTQLRSMLGSYFEVVAFRAPFVLMVQTLYFVAFFLWRCAGMMLLGMALYKWGFLDGRSSERTYAVTAALCIPVGLAFAWKGIAELELVKFAMPQRAVLDLWNYGGSVLASVGYAAAWLLIIKRQALETIRRSLAAVGQMALSNYLLQSIATSVLFLGWGVGLAGRFHYGQQLIVVAAIWVFQLAISPYWLARHRFGPAEWAWRSLTYWKRQPMHRDPRPFDAGSFTAKV